MMYLKLCVFRVFAFLRYSLNFLVEELKNPDRSVSY